MPAHILKRTRRRHRRHTRRNLIQLKRLRQQPHSLLPDLKDPLLAQLRSSSSARHAKQVHAPAAAAVGRIVRDAIAGAHRVLRRLVDGFADLDDVVEDGRVDQARGGHGVVLVGQRGEDLGRELEPWAVEGGDVAPVSMRSRSAWFDTAFRGV
jgi:hypothetical protein